MSILGADLISYMLYHEGCETLVKALLDLDTSLDDDTKSHLMAQSTYDDPLTHVLKRQSPLFCAFEGGHVEIARTLIDSVKQLGMKDDFSIHPLTCYLIRAIKGDRQNVIKFLLEEVMTPEDHALLNSDEFWQSLPIARVLSLPAGIAEDLSDSCNNA
jgi:hypothetical protein